MRVRVWVTRFMSTRKMFRISLTTGPQTPFNNAHKIISFTVKDQQERGRGYWKLNSSVLNDNADVAMVRQTIVNEDKLNILDKQRWWDIFSPVSVLRLLITPNTNILLRIPPGKKLRT